MDRVERLIEQAKVQAELEKREVRRTQELEASETEQPKDGPK